MSTVLWLTAGSVASPILAFTGATVGARIAGRSDNRLDKWRRREEVMRTIRWAADKAVDPDSRSGQIGFAALRGLLSSEMLQPEDERFLEVVTSAALNQVLERVTTAVDTELEEE